MNILNVTSGVQNNLLQSYFGETGIEYTIGRVPMGGCDFSTRKYTYDDTEDDFMLSHFSLASEDLEYKIPVIKRALSMSRSPIPLYASPWSAPAWMKTNNDLAGQGSLKGQPGGPYYKTWANYFVRFLDEYAANDVHFWGITAQNEPLDGRIKNFSFNAMAFTAEQQRDFIASDLGPALAAGGYGKLKLMILDDQRLMLPQWARVVLSDPEAAKFVSGIAVHWYIDFLVPVSILSDTHKEFPDTFILATEACNGDLPWDIQKVKLGSWKRGENYAHSITEDLNNWAIGWTDWNLALNTNGGPNWAKNFVDSPIIVNAETDEFYKQPTYYAIGHFR
ncbi:PREDICTED: glucosylceramidase-like [Priapulus caudatus]|uniref:Glucosylceramidase n=1 Tax=Priapulus caudatus TaxID=37621 RepID=A0ABM1F1B3_PRICU|nr:PREDICTED: glucosylceramidase-like [Priapulus caudatus]